MSRKPFVLVGIVVLGVVMAVLISHPSSPPKPRAVAETPVPTARALVPEKTPDSVVTATPSPHKDTKEALATARRFLKDYLPYSYGNGNPQFLDATLGFRKDLLQSPPDVPKDIRKYEAKVTLLQAGVIENDSIVVGAMVKDTQGAHYPVQMTLVNAAGKWMVAGLGG